MKEKKRVAGRFWHKKKRKEKKRKGMYDVSSGHAPEKESRGDNKSNLGLV
jgi:hypothetical protein